MTIEPHYLTKNLLTFFLILSGFSFTQAQQIIIKGIITDSLQQPLISTNVIAISKAENGLKFGITDEQGRYKLQLTKDLGYTITASYLGFAKQERVLIAIKDSIINFTLQESNEELDEVILVQPVTVKEDTIIYNADSFINGKERKLKQVLEKLPGVEVDRAGNVTVNGKKVKKFLVEGKRFFTGDPKLGVNNIPADAIDKIEVLDNHSDIGFLKGLEDSEDMAMNIKLKEDKKKFTFGDIGVASGVTDSENYIIHPSLFYYSPKTNVNFIADLNNTGEKSFTIKEFINFEGGFSKLMNDASAYFQLYNSDFAQFLEADDFKASTHKFGAFNITNSLTNKLDLSAYIIVTNTSNKTEMQTRNIYTGVTNLTESRSVFGQSNNTFSLGKLSLNYKASNKTEVYFNSFIKLANNNKQSNINTIRAVNTNIQTSKENTPFTAKQNLEFHKQQNLKHTFSVVGNYSYTHSTPTTNWLTNQELLNGLLPLITSTNYNIQQLKISNRNQVNIIAKHYWVLDRFNHVYTTLGSAYTADHYTTNEQQILADNTINNFNTDGFGNNNSYRFNDSYIGLHYKFKKGIFVVKPGVFYHNYNWNTNKNNQSRQTKSYLLPELTTKIEFKKSEKIVLKYNLVPQFAQVHQVANKYILSNFNTIYQGNNNLENSLSHQASISYYKFNLYRGIFINAGIYFRKKIKNIQSTIQQIDINTINTSIQSYNPEASWMLNANVSKRISNFKVSINTNYNNNTNTQYINSSLQKSSADSYSVELGMKTKFDKKYPNLSISHQNQYSLYTTANNKSEFLHKKTTLELDYIFLKDFILTADYNYTDYSNKEKTTINYFTNSNATLFYQKEDSPWGFEFSTANIFNRKFKNNNSFSNYVVSDTQTYIIPRMLLFKVAYKL
jgi:hypothetical protein